MEIFVSHFRKILYKDNEPEAWVLLMMPTALMTTSGMNLDAHLEGLIFPAVAWPHDDWSPLLEHLTLHVEDEAVQR